MTPVDTPKAPSPIPTLTLADIWERIQGSDYVQRIALAVYRGECMELALLEPNEPLVVGRAPSTGLQLDDRALSREHAQFVLLEQNRVRVSDMRSKNGVWMGTRRILEGELGVGDEVRIGSVRIQVQAVGGKGSSLDLVSGDVLRRSVEDELARARQFHRSFALLFVRVASLSNDKAWLERIRTRIRPVDQMALHGLEAVEILLPETGAEEAHRVAQILAGPTTSASEQLFVGIAPYPEAGQSVDSLFEACRDASERASVSNPVELAGVATVPLTAASVSQQGFIAGIRLRPVIEATQQIANSKLPVILHGETGTGKEVLATLIHSSGPRKNARMVRVNCGAIPKDLLESTLFGHEKGAFTGALQQHKGVFEQADGGTVFLDELGELPLAAQVALLRVLETGMFTRVGATREMACDVRVVAATHRNLEMMVKDGQFREDLYYRLSGAVIEIPPLRERTDEIEPLAKHVLAKANQTHGRHVQGIAPDALPLLLSYDWPGNVRELKNVIERAAVMARGSFITPHDLPARLWTRRTESAQAPVAAAVAPSTLPPAPPAAPNVGTTSSQPAMPIAPDAAPIRVRSQVSEYETTLIRETLEASGWNRAETARKLGVPLRTLAYRIKVLGIKKP